MAGKILPAKNRRYKKKGIKKTRKRCVFMPSQEKEVNLRLLTGVGDYRMPSPEGEGGPSLTVDEVLQYNSHHHLVEAVQKLQLLNLHFISLSFIRTNQELLLIHRLPRPRLVPRAASQRTLRSPFSRRRRLFSPLWRRQSPLRAPRGIFWRKKSR